MRSLFCALATSGHTAAVPRNVMNARRRISAPDSDTNTTDPTTSKRFFCTRSGARSLPTQFHHDATSDAAQAVVGESTCGRDHPEHVVENFVWVYGGDSGILQEFS